MPLALSATGPNTSMLMVLPVSVSRPMPHMATPYATKTGGVPVYISTEVRIATAMMMTAQTVLSYPTAMPWMMLVACPVRQLLASDLTGSYSVPVQYSVHLLRAMARMMPTRHVQAGRMSSTPVLTSLKPRFTQNG